jgi:hypothetical protein
MIDDVVVGSPHNCRATCRDMPEGQVSRPEQRLQVQRGVGGCGCGCATHGAGDRGSLDAMRRATGRRVAERISGQVRV